MIDTAIDLSLHPKQEEALHSSATEILWGGAAGGGKALALDTLVPTPEGYTTIKNIKVGDCVFDDEGNTTRVIATTDIMLNRRCYKLTFSDKTQVVADESHLWRTYDTKERSQWHRRTPEFREARRQRRESRSKGIRPDNIERNKGNTPAIKEAPTGTVRTTKEILETLRNKRGLNHSIELAKPLLLPEANLLIDPYVLGVWLGDGSSNGGGITNPDLEIIEEIRRRGYKVKKWASFYAWGVFGIKTLLVKLNLLHNKHIPPEYLRASYQQRLDLLCGLMDTDGTCDVDGGAEFYSINKQLAEQTAELMCTLGLKPTITTKIPYCNGKQCALCYRVKITTKHPIFLLSRKKERQNSIERPTQHRRMIESIESIESVPVRCIQVENPSGMFLITNRFIPTHNSHFSRVASIIWCTEIPQLQVYIFRRHFDDVIKNHMEGSTGFRAMLSKWVDLGLCKITETEVRFLFNGSKIYLCHCQFDADRWKYSGYEMHVLILEEGVQFPESVIRFLRHRVRMPLDMQARLPDKYKHRFPRLIITSNPVGGEGRDYLKATFVDARPPMKIEKTEDGEGGFLRQFIPAKLQDNPSLDPIKYKENLSGLGTPELVEAMLSGSWDAISGAYFSMWREWIKNGGICMPFNIPSGWTLMRGFDWGSAEPFSVGWWACCNGEQPDMSHLSKKHQRYFPKGALVQYREWYGMPPGKFNKGLRMRNEDIALEIVRRSEGEKIAYTVTDSLPFQHRGGVTIAEVFMKHGVLLRMGDTKRVPGWQQMISRFLGQEINGEVYPMIYVFDICREFMRTLPQLMHKETDPEDIADYQEDHVADQTRLVCMSRPWARPKEVVPPMRGLQTATFGEVLRNYDKNMNSRTNPLAQY